jgi:hypothetical protein
MVPYSADIRLLPLSEGGEGKRSNDRGLCKSYQVYKYEIDIANTISAIADLKLPTALFNGQVTRLSR